MQGMIKDWLSKDRIDDSFIQNFRVIAGSDLDDCGDSTGFFSEIGLNLSGSDDSLSEEIALNTMILMSGRSDMPLSRNRAKLIAEKKMKRSFRDSDFDGMMSWYLGSEDDEDLDEWSTDDLEDEEDELPTGDLEELEEGEDEVDTGDLDEEMEEEETTSSKSKISAEDKERILGYYNQFYKGILSELVKRYTSMFSSGYEVIKPVGVLGRMGMYSLSGTNMVEDMNAVSRRMYLNFANRMGFVECDDRSNIKIGEKIYSMYNEGNGVPVYFPRKMVEYAFGREAPSGDDQNSLKTYTKHSNASNWSTYCEKEVKSSLIQVIKASVLKFVIETARRDDIEYYDDSIANRLKDFLGYMLLCLSTCILVVEYKRRKRGYEEDVYSFKVRVCDPLNRLENVDMTEVIINDCFMGSTGDVPFSYPVREEKEVFVREFAHEFNHDSSQASPLFAYKAYLSLRDQNVEPDWNNMILGTFEDGSILRNGKHGVNLCARLTHHIDAGSRAGKGVMTLAIMASGIYSKKIPFYLDRKPDMASMFKSLSPNMFVVNGAVYGTDDTYGTFASQDSWINENNIPDYICNILECGKSWVDLGDLFYMRALKLVMGIIIARGSGGLDDPKIGGSNGILLVVDEFKNFQENYALLVSKFKNNLPASEDKYDIERSNLDKLLEKHGEESSEYKSQLARFMRSYNNETFYSLSYLNSMVTDLEFLSTKRDAGFNPIENSLSDIFVIGQNLEHGDLDFAEFREMLTTGRYKSCGRKGVTGSYKIDFTKDSFGYSMVSFKTCDAFFGRNMEDGREVYLAQTNKSSKACGRLDDKASNFAYMSSFTDETRRKIIGGKVSDNIELANNCVYFKPFLVLNDAKEGDTYTTQMFKRCAGPNENEPWVTPDEIIRDNPNADGSFVNEAVGFEGYLRLMGIGNYSDILERGSDVANYVVQSLLGYPGDWFDFITDLRPEWLFTIKDIVEAYRSGYASLLSKPDKNPVTMEFSKFNPSIFGLESSGEHLDGDLEDYYDFETQMMSNDIDMADIFEDEEEYSCGDSRESRYEDTLDLDEEFNLDDFMYEDVKEEPVSASEEDIEDVLRNNGDSKDAIIAELLERIKKLESMLTSGRTENYSRPEMDYYADPSFGEKIFENTMNEYGYRKSSDKSIFNDRIDFDGGVDSYAQLVDLITNDVLRKFGGVENIVSFKVIGGSIIVNGYYYRCKAGDIFARNLPYDVRMEINAGNIGRLFHYEYLLAMPRLRDIEFDSVAFVYDYVSYAMGYGSKVSVDLFFRDILSLQCLCIGKKLFRRATFMEDIRNDDTFYNPRASERFANYSEELLGRGNKSSWEFTKGMMNSKKYGKVVKTLGVAGGLAATGVTGAGKLAVKGGRKAWQGIASLGRSFKGMMDDSSKF